jgi:hypothetical protein
LPKLQPRIRVFNPINDGPEDRVTIVDPLTGLERPVVGLRLGYVSVVGAGGAALMLPNQWSMVKQLHTVPDSAEEFTGYSIGVDLIAWDLPGAGGAYRPNGSAKVRNVELPADYSHVTWSRLRAGARPGDARMDRRLRAGRISRFRVCNRPTTRSGR